MSTNMTLRPGGLLRALVVTVGALASTAALAGNAPPAFYNDTAAGTTVSNTASVTYSVSSIAQPAITSTADTFTVDRRIDVFVTEESNSAAAVTPGQTVFGTTTALGFLVTNLGNDTQDIAVTAANRADGADDDFGLTPTDLFDVTGPFLYYADTDNDGVFDPGTDDVALPVSGGQPYLDEVLKDTTRRVWVVPTSIPTTLVPAPDADVVNGNIAVVSLTAQVYTVGAGPGALGVVATNDIASADVPGGLAQNVWADAAGEYDVARDGIHSNDDVYQIASAVISITKSSAVISDPINGTTNQKRIPGAVVRYTITVANAAAATATANPVVISDTLPLNVTYVTGTLYESTDTTCGDVGDTPLSDVVSNDLGHIVGTTITFGDSTGTDLSLAPSDAISYCYDVTID